MIRPRNWRSRLLWSLVTADIFVVNDAAETWVPLIVIEPDTSDVRPTAVVDCPKRTSFTRYPDCEPLDTAHEPATETVAAPDAVPLLTESSDSFLGGVPSMKWM